MFEPSGKPRIFGLPPGVDFPQVLLDGLLTRCAGMDPDALAHVEIFVNTRRMQRRIVELLQKGPALLLPRVRVVTDLAADALMADLPPAVSPLRRRLELAQLVAKLLESEPDLAPRSAMFDLADSLADLMDEMRGEGVGPDAIRALDPRDQSGHWQRSLKFVTLVDTFFGPESGQAPDIEARQRLVIERLAQRWATAPPEHPVIVAGSTGSRGATSLFMQIVSKLPQGAVVLPGVDFDMPADVWDRLDSAMTAEDHPQFRFARLMAALYGHPKDIRLWHQDAKSPSPARNRLISLALRPAPVTDQWLTEGRHLKDIGGASAGMSLIEAQSTRLEANAIALALREAAENGVTAALITPDRTLTRQVTAALDRWGIIPDDSAGRPLPLSPPGRFLRHVSELFGQVVTVDALLTLLKHPLTASGGDGRGQHLLHTRELELHLRRYGPPFPKRADLLRWAGKGGEDRLSWGNWIGGLIGQLLVSDARLLTDHLAHHLQVADALAAGSGQSGFGSLWDAAAGREARRWVNELQRESPHGGVMTSNDYVALFHAVLQRGEVREPVQAHSGVMIWGTLEARVQGADLVILGGLNEGIWPEAPKPDPWLNRRMRDQAGLMLPERRIGLAAHDFQQAIAARKVILTRSVRDAEAQTVPSRWLNRLCNLMEGLPEDGPLALKDMRARGTVWLGWADALDTPGVSVPAEPRPSPQPPVAMRPREISITEVQRLIRDPYAIYARRVLGLSALDPLRRQPDPPLRGTLIHRILEQFIKDAPVADPIADKARLFAIADAVLQADAPWPTAQRIWRAKLMRVADWFIETEIQRQSGAAPLALERWARMEIPEVDTVLVGKIDRVDQMVGGRLAIYDYKSGNPPQKGVQENFDKQLMLSAMLAERGALEGLKPEVVAQIAYIGFGSASKFDPVEPEFGATAAVLADLTALLAAYRRREKGYASRRAVEDTGFGGDFDHLARLGEWDESFEPVGILVG